MPPQLLNRDRVRAPHTTPRTLRRGAPLAEAAQHDVVLGDLEAHLSRELADRALQRAVLEGDHAAAVAADRVVMVVRQPGSIRS